LDNNAIARDIKGRLSTVTVNGTDYTLASPSRDTWLKIFTCPDDGKNDRVVWGLTYKANRGYGGISGTLAKSAGVFFRTGTVMTLDFIEQGDGMTQTIMFGEQTRRGNLISALGVTPSVDNSTNPPTTTFSNSPTDDTYFSIDLARLVDSSGSTVGLASGSLAIPSTVASIGTNMINVGPNDGLGVSSNHAGVVHVAFCDGRAQGISESINFRVWLALVTPNGQRKGQGILGTSDF
jgi:hypothetical protein